MTAEKRRNTKTSRIEPLTHGRPVSMPVTLYSAGKSMAHRKRSFARGSYCCPNFYFFCPNNVSMKREDQQDATIRCLLLTYVSTCFGHHYAHLQEKKGPTTATNHIQQNQNNTPNTVTGPFFS